MLKPCLDCGRLSGGTRCFFHERIHKKIYAQQGRLRRGPKWDAFSRNLRDYWASQGRTCIDAWEGGCRGIIQVDHVTPGSSLGGYQPRCAYHNNKKGNR